ncbi:hypothetical protein [Glycomyces sp. NPDC047010]
MSIEPGPGVGQHLTVAHDAWDGYGAGYESSWYADPSYTWTGELF